MPTVRLGQFSREVARARDLVGVGQSLASMTHGRLDGSDLYRSALVHAVAALDSYVHGIVLDRAVDILMTRIPSGSGGKVGLHFGAISQIFAAAASGPADMEITARTYVAERLGLETYQRPDDISSGLAMVGLNKIWSSAFPKDAGAVKTALGVVVSRRNRIVHECDLDPLSPGNVTPLTDVDALEAIEIVENVVTAIDACC